jgi:hypothetical protein
VANRFTTDEQKGLKDIQKEEMTLIPMTRMRTRTVIPTMSRGVNNVPFDVSHVAFDVSSLC